MSDTPEADSAVGDRQPDAVVSDRQTEGETDARTTEDLLSGDDAEDVDDFDSEGVTRWEATKYIAPFVLLGLTNVVLLLRWGVDPLWAFMIFPPILFVSVLGWIAFRTGFAQDRTGEA